MELIHLFPDCTVLRMISMLWQSVNVESKYAEVMFVFDVDWIAPFNIIVILLYINSIFLLDSSGLLVPAECWSPIWDYEESPAKLPWPADSKDLGSPSLLVFGLASNVSIVFICSIAPVSSCMWPSTELTRVFKEETEPKDLSSEKFGSLSVWEIVLGIAGGDLKEEGDWPVDHLRVVLFPSVETESSSFP